MKGMLKKPSAWIPIVMSLIALSLVLGYVIVIGIPEKPAEDEGAAAHIWQILMAGQIPIIFYFAFKYLPKNLRQAGIVLGLQAFAFLTSFAALFYFEHILQ